MTHGCVVKLNLESNSVVILRDSGFSEIVIPSSQLILSIKEAVKQAEEMEDYWNRQADKWRKEMYKRENETA